MSTTTDYQTELRRLKDSRPKCDRTNCHEPSTLRSVLCRAHLKEHEDRMRALSRSYDKFGALPGIGIEICPHCGAERQTTNNLCKCDPD